MTQYILRRLVIAFPVLIAITVINFLFINLAPGDPLSYMTSPEFGFRPDQVEMWRQRFGLDQPLPVRYFYWLKEAAQGNLGWRMVADDRRPINQVLAERLPLTFELTIWALLVSNVLGISLGVIAALRQYSLLDHILTFISFFLASTPGFFLAVGLIFLLALLLDWFPTHGVRTPGVPATFLDRLHHLALPVLSLSLGSWAGMMRQARASMLEVLHQEYVTTARAKGLQERVVFLRHAFRNALLPLITLIGLQIPWLVGGSIIIESIFAWPGMGALAISAVQARDYNTLMALNLVGAVAVLITNLFTDIFYAVADPRIRYE
ncbi:MAG: ABC transporter permease [Caldilinea sp. CFX5]|nr:ABC transporter permease [Caldilinea sp. CFX5]